MTKIAAWPVVARDRIVQAFKPGGSPTAEPPFRTLRRHEWVSPGVRVTLFGERGISGQLTVFSSLNVAAARLARHGSAAAAERVAHAAADLESGPEFAMLHRLLSALPDGQAEQVVKGALPDGAPTALADALRAVASRTEQVRADISFPSSSVDVILTGYVAELNEGHAVLVQAKGPATLVPRWMVDAAGRGQVGALLALVADKLDGASAVVEAVPAIEMEDTSDTGGFSPYGRGDARARSITADDARLLAGQPRPLRIIVPVTVDG
jgi:hypothetical protein